MAREINTNRRDDLFAATPPLEALKTILSMTATANKGEVIMVNDISRAFFNAKVERDVFVQLPGEDRWRGEEGMCGKLRLSMYGIRDAAQTWYKEYSSTTHTNRLHSGQSIPTYVLPPNQTHPNIRAWR